MVPNMKADWDHIGQIIAGKKRFQVLIRLSEGQCTPKQLSEELGLRMSNISTALKELVSYNCVKNLTPDNKKGKIFGITPYGKKTLKKIHEMTRPKGKRRIL